MWVLIHFSLALLGLEQIRQLYLIEPGMKFSQCMGDTFRMDPRLHTSWILASLQNPSTGEGGVDRVVTTKACRKTEDAA